MTSNQKSTSASVPLSSRKRATVRSKGETPLGASIAEGDSGIASSCSRGLGGLALMSTTEDARLFSKWKFNHPLLV